MIRLQSDCLVFEMASGENIPFSAEQVTVELLGDAAHQLDPELVSHAAQAVLHYFKVELNRQSVSVVEFSQALARVLRGFGLDVKAAEEQEESESESDAESEAERPAGTDLRRLATESGKGFELAFYRRLRQELHEQLRQAPRVICFRGLRGCVKQLAGARRWSQRCEQVSDQIVDFLRGCFINESPSNCALVIL